LQSQLAKSALELRDCIHSFGSHASCFGRQDRPNLLKRIGRNASTDRPGLRKPIDLAVQRHDSTSLDYGIPVGSGAAYRQPSYSEGTAFSGHHQLPVRTSMAQPVKQGRNEERRIRRMQHAGNTAHSDGLRLPPTAASVGRLSQHPASHALSVTTNLN
jgi:hypothetical protein